MKLLTLFLPALIAYGALGVWTPSPADLSASLARAESQWGRHAPDGSIHMSSSLGSCSPFHGGRYAASELEFGIIDINSACSWSPALLDQVVLHEYGHLLFGPGHSKDSHSIRYWKLKAGQRILPADLPAAAAVSVVVVDFQQRTY